jgi:5'-nucleotidase
MVRKTIEVGIPQGILVNVNFPDCEPGEVAGTAVVNQGRRDQEFLRLEERQDGRGNPYFWIAFARGLINPGHGTDLWAIQNRRISVTPLRLDMTDEPTLTHYVQAFA